MASVSVKVTGLKEVQAQVKAFQAKLEKVVDKEVQDTVDKWVKQARRDAPKNYGRLAGDITRKKNGTADHSMVSNASYSPYLEFGTKGNYKPIPGIDASQFKGKGEKGNLSLYDAILEWVKKKQIAGRYSVKTRRRVGKKSDRQKENEQMAFAIMLSILKNGIKAQPFFFKQANQEELVKAVEQAIKQANERS
jgi:hypothetical protein